MNPNLNDLYAYPEHITDRDIHIEELALQCRLLEDRIKGVLANSSSDFADLFLSYIALRDELEVFTIRKAMRFSSKTGIFSPDDR